jgi:hydrogenase nickel incorporation protein HypB
MCTTCGCGHGETRIEGRAHEPAHRHDHARAHAHDDRHDDGPGHAHGPDGAIHFGAGPAGSAAPGQAQSRLVAIEEDVLARNDAIAARNRARLAASGTLALNLVSSPGAGKTTLLVETLGRLGDAPAAVIEGDQETSADAERIRATGAPAVQVNTGKGCHLDAAMIATALDHLPPVEGGTVFIENVGNLVCPAGFDLGEAHKVVVVSVTEGEDKPLKYPGIFAASDLLLVTKTDIAPHIGADIDLLVANARRIRPGIGAIRLSARTGEGMEAWLAWLAGARAMRAATE